MIYGIRLYGKDILRSPCCFVDNHSGTSLDVSFCKTDQIKGDRENEKEI